MPAHSVDQMMHVISALVLALISHGAHGQISELGKWSITICFALQMYNVYAVYAENCSSVPEESFRLYNALMIQSLKVECFKFADLVSGQQYAMWDLGVLMPPRQHADL